MKNFFLYVLCCLIGVQVTQTQRIIRIPGPIHFHGVVGKLPPKDEHLNKVDEYASYIASVVYPLIVQGMPDSHTIMVVRPIDVSIPEIWLSGKLYLTDLTVNGINKAILEDVKISTKDQRMDFIIVGPETSVTANFLLEAVVGPAPIKLSGSIRFGLQELRMEGAVGVTRLQLPLSGEVYQVDSGEVNVDVADVLINVTDGEDLEKELNYLKSRIFNEIADQVGNTVLRETLKEVNRLLEKIPAPKAESYLTPH